MQPIKYLKKWLLNNSNEQHCLFTLTDLRALYPTLSHNAFKTLLSRAVKSEILLRICRGIYLYPHASTLTGLLLYRVASLLRANEFNYISLETILSDSGIISQIPINQITLMSSGRSNIINCGTFGKIEFIHTSRAPEALQQDLIYDQSCGLWKANIKLALQDMKYTHRNCDLINWELARELI